MTFRYLCDRIVGRAGSVLLPRYKPQERHSPPLPFLVTTLERITKMSYFEAIMIAVFAILGGLIAYSLYIDLSRNKSTKNGDAEGDQTVVDLTLNPIDQTYSLPPLQISKWAMGQFVRWAIITNLVGMITFVSMILIGVMLGHNLSWKTLTEFNLMSVGVGFLTLQLLYLLDSLKIVRLNMTAVRLVLGEYESDVRGLCYFPRFITELVEAERKVIERDLPGVEEDIYYGDPEKTQEGKDGPGVIPEGKVMALRVSFIGRNTNENFKVMWPTDSQIEVGVIPKDDELLTPVTADIKPSYGFQIFDLHRLIVNVGSVDEAVRNMDDFVTAGFTSRLQKISMAEALYLMEEISEALEDALSRFCRDWGIKVTFARIKNIRVPHGINSARVQAAAAIQIAKSLERVSIGEKAKRINEGQGAAEAERLMLVARADGAEKRREVAAKPGGLQVITADGITEAIVKSNSSVFLPSDNVFAMAAGIGKLAQMLPDGSDKSGSSQTAPATASNDVEVSRENSQDSATTATSTSTTTSTQAPENGGGRRRRKRGRK